MAKGKGKDYKFVGRAVSGRGRNLEAAVNDLDDLWNSRPSLVMHDWGVLSLEMKVGGVVTVVEVADRAVIDAVEGGDFSALVQYLAEKAGTTVAEMTTMLERADEVVATVDRIRPPTDPDFWKPTSGTEAEVVLPAVIVSWAAGVSAQKIPKKERQRMVTLVATIGQQEGKSIAEISKQAHVPRSTLKDALERDRRVREAKVAARPAGKRLDATERAAVARAYAETSNAAEVARRLNVAPRTVRSVIARESDLVESMRKWVTKDRLVGLVESGLSASAAGRELGIPGRTARAWIRAARETEEE